VWAIAGLDLVVIGAVLLTAYGITDLGTTSTTVLQDSGFVVALIGFLLSGAIILSKQPRNIIGWLLMIPAIAVPVGELARIWALSLDPTPVTADPLVWLAVWFSGVSWVFLIYPIFFLLLTFPNGKLPSPRWRWVTWLAVGMVAFFLFTIAFLERLAITNDAEVVELSVTNPIGLLPESFVNGAFGGPLWSLLLVVTPVAGMLALIKRFRVGSSVERQQLKWPLYGFVLFGLGYAWTALASGATGPIAETLFGLSIVAIPASVAVAVLRYRLYDLGRIVSRTVMYLVVAVLLVGVYILAVLGLGSIMGRDNPVAVAAATLAAAALFNPMRNRIRHWVDRQFNRPRFNAERVIDTFTATLRDRVDTDDVVSGWVGVVSETMQPVTVAAWVNLHVRE
jgi:hypothetical protein